LSQEIWSFFVQFTALVCVFQNLTGRWLSTFFIKKLSNYFFTKNWLSQRPVAFSQMDKVMGKSIKMRKKICDNLSY
jgi:hypothetical protein